MLGAGQRYLHHPRPIDPQLGGGSCYKDASFTAHPPSSFLHLNVWLDAVCKSLEGIDVEHQIDVLTMTGFKAFMLHIYVSEWIKLG